MARLTAVPATLPGTVPPPRTWRSSEPEGEGPGLRMLSPAAHRLFGLVCQAATARTRRPISWAGLRDAREVALAFDLDTLEARPDLDTALERLGLTWADALRLARTADLEVKWK